MYTYPSELPTFGFRTMTAESTKTGQTCPVVKYLITILIYWILLRNLLQCSRQVWSQILRYLYNTIKTRRILQCFIELQRIANFACQSCMHVCVCVKTSCSKFNSVLPHLFGKLPISAKVCIIISGSYEVDKIKFYRTLITCCWAGRLIMHLHEGNYFHTRHCNFKFHYFKR